VPAKQTKMIINYHLSLGQSMLMISISKPAIKCKKRSVNQIKILLCYPCSKFKII